MANLLSALSQIAQQDRDYRQNEHMGKVFAANPDFGQQLYGAQAQQDQLRILKNEEARKQQQRSALAELAQGFQNGPIDRQSALLQIAAQTGDPDFLSSAFGIGQNTPAPIQIANEIARRRASGDIEGALLLEQSAKLGEKGTYTDPQTGEVRVIPGFAPAVGTIAGAKADAANISDLTYDPTTAGLAEAEKIRAQQQGDKNKKSTQATEVVNLADEAETYLDKATGSGLGSIVAGGKRFIGKSDESTQANAALEVIGGKLVSNIPRMEGPQSDKDVQMYRDMAGRIADPSVPADDKRAALTVLRSLAEKYQSASPSIDPRRQRLLDLRAKKGGI